MNIITFFGLKAFWQWCNFTFGPLKLHKVFRTSIYLCRIHCSPSILPHRPAHQRHLWLPRKQNAETNGSAAVAEAHAHTLGRTEPVRIWRFAGTQLEMWAEVWKLALLQLLLLEFCWAKGKVSSSLLSWKEKKGGGWVGGCGLIIAIIKTHRWNRN